MVRLHFGVICKGRTLLSASYGTTFPCIQNLDARSCLSILLYICNDEVDADNVLGFHTELFVFVSKLSEIDKFCSIGSYLA
jgi:hypothetical protein